MIAARYRFEFIDLHMSVFGAVFILHILQKPFQYCVVYDVSSSRLLAVPLSHYLKDCKLRKGTRMCTEISSMPVVAVTSA